MPKRTWGDEATAPEPVPYVIVCSRDGRGDPAEVLNKSAAWRSVRRKAEAAGWTAVITYALAWTADRYYLNGKLDKAAHHVHSVALRLVRGPVRAIGVWLVESAMPDVPASGWSFESGLTRGGPPGALNLTAFREALA